MCKWNLRWVRLSEKDTKRIYPQSWLFGRFRAAECVHYIVKNKATFEKVGCQESWLKTLVVILLCFLFFGTWVERKIAVEKVGSQEALAYNQAPMLKQSPLGKAAYVQTIVWVEVQVHHHCLRHRHCCWNGSHHEWCHRETVSDQAPHGIALDAPYDQKRGAHNWVLGSKMVCKWSESNQNGPNAHEMQWIKFIMLKNGPWDLDWVQSIFGFLFVFFTWSDPDKSFKIIPRLCKWLPTHVLDKLHAGQRDHWEGGFISPDLWWFVFLSHRKSWHVTRIIH